MSQIQSSLKNVPQSNPLQTSEATSSAPLSSPAVTAASKPQFQVMPKPVLMPNAQLKQYTLAPTTTTHQQQTKLIPKTHPPTHIAPKLAPRPALQPKIAKSLDSSLQSMLSSDPNQKNVPCIITSKQWVLPPRPKAGRKPDKKKQNKKNTTVDNSTGVCAAAMNASQSHGMTNLSDTLTNLNIQNSPSIISSTASSNSTMISSAVNTEFAKISKAVSGKNSISNVKQKELKNQLDSATQENNKLKSIIEKLKQEIEQLHAAIPPVPVALTIPPNDLANSQNTPSPLSFNPLTNTTTNESTVVSTPQFLDFPLETPAEITSTTPLQTLPDPEIYVSPTIDPTKIDLLIQENYKMDLMIKEEEKEKKALLLKEPIKKKRQYKKKKKQETSPIKVCATDNTPSPLSVNNTDSLLSDIPNLSSILDNDSSDFLINEESHHFLNPIDEEEEILHPSKKRSLKLERSISCLVDSSRQYSPHLSHALSRSLSTNPSSSNDISWSHSASAFLNEDAMLNSHQDVENMLERNGEDVDVDDWNVQLLNENKSLPITNGLTDWDEEEAKFVNVGSFW